jgi:4-hydroxy-tetrahydrodipicolinate reductase
MLTESDRVPTKGASLTVERGAVCGPIQDGIGHRRGKPIVTLHMEAYLGEPDSYDTVRIVGTPSLSRTVPAGVPGDATTAALAVNAIPKVLSAAPGLRTMRDMPLIPFFAGRRR